MYPRQDQFQEQSQVSQTHSNFQRPLLYTREQEEQLTGLTNLKNFGIPLDSVQEEHLKFLQEIGFQQHQYQQQLLQKQQLMSQEVRMQNNNENLFGFFNNSDETTANFEEVDQCYSQNYNTAMDGFGRQIRVSPRNPNKILESSRPNSITPTPIPHFHNPFSTIASSISVIDNRSPEDDKEKMRIKNIEDMVKLLEYDKLTKKILAQKSLFDSGKLKECIEKLDPLCNNSNTLSDVGKEIIKKSTKNVLWEYLIKLLNTYFDTKIPN